MRVHVPSEQRTLRPFVRYRTPVQSPYACVITTTWRACLDGRVSALGGGRGLA